MSTRSLQGHTRATAVTPALRTSTKLAFHSHHQHTSRAAIHRLQPATQHYGQPNSSPTGTTTHTPQPSLHNHQSIPLTSTGTHPTTNTQSANPQPHSNLVPTGRFSPPDRIHPHTTGSQIATC